MSAPPSPRTPIDPLDNLDLPRILCLHGGGTNAEVLRMQARAFISELSHHYRLVFADAPFLCEPHPAIIPVYEENAPFRMWYRWRSDQPRCGGAKPVQVDGDEDVASERTRDAEDDERDDDEVIVGEMEYQMRSTMEEDDREGATGPWVGLMGFSQGARLAGSILFDRQLRMQQVEKHSGSDSDSSGSSTSDNRHLTTSISNVVENHPEVEGFAGGHWNFGILVAGQGPFLTLSELGAKSGMTEAPGILPDFRGAPSKTMYGPAHGPSQQQKLVLPTLHVHGLKDPMQAKMRLWYEAQFDKTKMGASSGASLIEWAGNHRLPFKKADMLPITEAILRMGS